MKRKRIDVLPSSKMIVYIRRLLSRWSRAYNRAGSRQQPRIARDCNHVFSAVRCRKCCITVNSFRDTGDVLPTWSFFCRERPSEIIEAALCADSIVTCDIKISFIWPRRCFFVRQIASWFLRGSFKKITSFLTRNPWSYERKWEREREKIALIHTIF